jgi:hypothetical protein
MPADYEDILARIRESRAARPSGGGSGSLSDTLEAIRESRARREMMPPVEPAAAPARPDAPVPEWARRYEGLTDVQAAANTQAQGGDVAHVISGGLIEGVPIVGPAIRAGADRAGAAIRSALPGGKSYDEELADVQGRGAQLKEEFPQTHAAAQLAGTVAGTAPVVAAAPAAFGLTQASRLAQAGASAASSATLATADLAGRKLVEEGRLPTVGEAAVTAAVGGAAGAVSPWLAEKLGKVPAWVAERFRNVRDPASAPTAANLATRVRASYEAAEAVEANLRADKVETFIATMRSRLTASGLNPSLHPRTTAALGDLDRAAAQGVQGGVSLQRLEQSRRVLLDAADTIDRPDRRMAFEAVRRLDKFIKSGIDPQHDLIATIPRATTLLSPTGGHSPRSLAALPAAR